MSRSTIKGAASFKRLIKALPDTANKRLIGFLNDAGPVLVGVMQSQLPVLASPRPNRTAGALRDSIKYKVTPTTLNLKVGQIAKRDVLFYGHILNVGRKAKTVPIRRGPRAGATMKISALPGLYVLNRVKVKFLDGSLPGYRALLDNILTEASQGAGND
ncbi:HK97 gp10 family phage protein [Sphingomonas bacterium]|uniref:HK97 gp10 family phage protein n=1 Tax=Sphingomonas bacterium TaxID=1895847 RepID=UPI001575251F|nr:HK97 gp10 family phage protein [Sphingomonas bacterium]